MTLSSDRSDLGIAVVGVGRWGRNVLRDFQGCTGARVLAACDPDLTRLSPIGAVDPQLTRVARFSDLGSCPGIDAVAICSPAETHLELCVSALDRGLHVFVEKPLCLSSRDARSLVEAAARRERVLVVGHQMLYHWGVEWLRTVLDLGLIGEPIGLACSRYNPVEAAEGVGPWWSLAPHDLSILLYLFPRAVLDVELSDLPPGDGSSGYRWARAAVRLEGGLSARVSCAFGVPKTRRVAVEGSAGVAVFDESGVRARVKLYLRDDRGVLRAKAPCALPELQSFRAVNEGIESCIPPLRLECEDFVRCVTEGGVPRNSGAAALGVVELLEAGADALTQRRVVRLGPRESGTRSSVSC